VSLILLLLTYATDYIADLEAFIWKENLQIQKFRGNRGTVFITNPDQYQHSKSTTLMAGMDCTRRLVCVHIPYLSSFLSDSLSDQITGRIFISSLSIRNSRFHVRLPACSHKSFTPRISINFSPYLPEYKVHYKH
jgi:hypothetical protein